MHGKHTSSTSNSFQWKTLPDKFPTPTQVGDVAGMAEKSASLQFPAIPATSSIPVSVAEPHLPAAAAISTSSPSLHTAVAQDEAHLHRPKIKPRQRHSTLKKTRNDRMIASPTTASATERSGNSCANQIDLPDVPANLIGPNPLWENFLPFCAKSDITVTNPFWGRFSNFSAVFLAASKLDASSPVVSGETYEEELRRHHSVRHFSDYTAIRVNQWRLDFPLHFAAATASETQHQTGEQSNREQAEQTEQARKSHQNSHVAALLSRGHSAAQLDRCGLAPIHYACYQERADAVRLLLDSDACSVNLTTSRTDHLAQTPLHIAAQMGHIEIVRLLLSQSDCDSSCADVCGRTAIQLVSDQMTDAPANRELQSLTGPSSLDETEYSIKTKIYSEIRHHHQHHSKTKVTAIQSANHNSFRESGGGPVKPRPIKIKPMKKKIHVHLEDDNVIKLDLSRGVSTRCRHLQNQMFHRLNMDAATLDPVFRFWIVSRKAQFQLGPDDMPMIVIKRWKPVLTSSSWSSLHFTSSIASSKSHVAGSVVSNSVGSSGRDVRLVWRRNALLSVECEKRIAGQLSSALHLLFHEALQNCTRRSLYPCLEHDIVVLGTILLHLHLQHCQQHINSSEHDANSELTGSILSASKKKSGLRLRTALFFRGSPDKEKNTARRHNNSHNELLETTRRPSLPTEKIVTQENDLLQQNRIVFNSTDILDNNSAIKESPHRLRDNEPQMTSRSCQETVDSSTFYSGNKMHQDEDSFRNNQLKRAKLFLSDSKNLALILPNVKLKSRSLQNFAHQIFNRLQTTWNSHSNKTRDQLRFRFLTLCWNLALYGVTFYPAQIYPNVNSIRQSTALPVYLGVNDIGIHIVESKYKTIVKSHRYDRVRLCHHVMMPSTNHQGVFSKFTKMSSSSNSALNQSMFDLSTDSSINPSSLFTNHNSKTEKKHPKKMQKQQQPHSNKLFVSSCSTANISSLASSTLAHQLTSKSSKHTHSPQHDSAHFAVAPQISKWESASSLYSFAGEESMQASSFSHLVSSLPISSKNDTISLPSSGGPQTTSKSTRRNPKFSSSVALLSSHQTRYMMLRLDPIELENRRPFNFPIIAAPSPDLPWTSSFDAAASSSIIADNQLPSANSIVMRVKIANQFLLTHFYQLQHSYLNTFASED